MKNIITDLYRGNYAAFERPFGHNSEQARILDRIINLEERIKAVLPAESHSLLKEYEDAVADLSGASCERDFFEGYRLGIRLMIAAWPDDSTRKQRANAED